MKKIGAAFVAACVGVVIVASLLGCGGGGKKTDANAPVVIDLWYGAAVTEAGPPPADWAVFKLIRDKLNIDLRITTLPSNESDQDVKIQAAGASNTLPDLFQVRRDVLVNLVKAGLVAPIDNLYTKMPNRTKVMYDADARGFTTINGKNYAMANPNLVAKNEGILIRKDWLDKLGLAAPVTTADYLNVMKAFTTQDPDGNGRADTYGYGAFIELNNYEEGLGRRFDPFFGAFGVAGTWNMTAANAGLNVRKDAYYDAMDFVSQMIAAGVIDPNWSSYKKDDFRAAWKQGRFGIMREQNAAFGSESNYAPFDKNFPNGEWIVIDPPKGPKGDSAVGVYVAGYRVFAVSANAAKAGKEDAIARLLDWMSSDEGYFLLGWGVEGVNYIKDADGVPVIDGIPDPSKAFSKPEMQPFTQLRNMVFYNSDIELIARYPAYRAATSGRPMSAYTILRDMQSRAWVNGMGSDSLPAPNADLKRFYEQGISEFLVGNRKLTADNWKAWVAEFDKLGGADWEAAGIQAAKDASYLR